jgi:hypothetical protein
MVGALLGALVAGLRAGRVVLLWGGERESLGVFSFLSKRQISGQSLWAHCGAHYGPNHGPIMGPILAALRAHNGSHSGPHSGLLGATRTTSEDVLTSHLSVVGAQCYRWSHTQFGGVFVLGRTWVPFWVPFWRQYWPHYGPIRAPLWAHYGPIVCLHGDKTDITIQLR